jgi:hypothetical protein
MILPNMINLEIIKEKEKPVKGTSLFGYKFFKKK